VVAESGDGPRDANQQQRDGRQRRKRPRGGRRTTQPDVISHDDDGDEERVRLLQQDDSDDINDNDADRYNGGSARDGQHLCQISFSCHVKCSIYVALCFVQKVQL